MEMTCPKCQGPMRTYERNGVNVDQCTECRGVFLDRGELERLVDAENSWHGESRQQPVQQGGGGGTGSLGSIVGEVMQQAKGHKQSGYGKQGHGYPPRKKKSFMDEIFG